MQAIQGTEATVLFVEHDMEIVGRYADRVLAFYAGRIIADGDPAAVLSMLSGTLRKRIGLLAVTLIGGSGGGAR
jgi:energy-coupling factor transporter ATP-binding protein EcfA2